MRVLQKVFSDSAFTAFRSIVSIVRRMVVVLLITNLLGEESYGIWVTVFATVTLFRTAGSIHLHGSLIRYSSQESGENQTYSDVLFLATVLGSLIAVLVVVMGVFVDLSLLFNGEVSDQYTLVIVSALLIVSLMLFNVNINFPRAKGHVKLFDSLKLSRVILETGVLVVVFLFGGGVIAGLAALLGLSLLMNVAIVAFVIMKFRLPLPDPANFGQYISYGIPMLPKELSGSLLAHTDKYLLAYFIGPAAVGIYAVAQAICKPLVTITGVFNPTLYPTISREWDEGNFDEIATVYETIFRYYTIIGIPAMVGTVVLADPLLRVISTAEIALQGLYLVPIFILGYFVRGYDNSIEYILTSAKRTDVIGASVTVSAILNIVLNVVLIPRFGMSGAAGATLASQMLLFASLVYYALSEVRFPIPWRSIGRSSLATLAMGGTLVVIPDLGIYETLAVYSIVGMVSYFTVLLLVGEFSRSELARAKRKTGGVLTQVRSVLSQFLSS